MELKEPKTGASEMLCNAALELFLGNIALRRT